MWFNLRLYVAMFTLQSQRLASWEEWTTCQHKLFIHQKQQFTTSLASQNAHKCIHLFCIKYGVKILELQYMSIYGWRVRITVVIIMIIMYSGWMCIRGAGGRRKHIFVRLSRRRSSQSLGRESSFFVLQLYFATFLLL